MYLFSCRLVYYPPSVHQLMYLVTCSIDFLLASIQVKIYKVIKGESVLYLCRAINSTKVHGSERSCGWHAVLLLDSQTTHELLSETTCGVFKRTRVCSENCVRGKSKRNLGTACGKTIYFQHNVKTGDGLDRGSCTTEEEMGSLLFYLALWARLHCH